MTIRLRPHHLLCSLTYVGKGYSPAFTVNMTAIAGRLAAGEAIEIVDGPDDLCAPLLSDSEPHCHRASVRERDAHAADEVGRLLGVTIEPGVRLTLERTVLRDLRSAFSGGDIRSACASCEWSDLCSTVSSGGYSGAML